MVKKEIENVIALGVKIDKYLVGRTVTIDNLMNDRVLSSVIGSDAKL